MAGVQGYRSFTLLLVATVGTFAGYSTLLPVVPLWAQAGGAGSAGAGATTAVFMLFTVATQLVMPWLLSRFGIRELLVCGSAIMAVLSVVFAASAQLWVLLAVSAGRGVGFGLVTVTSSLLIAVLLPEAERGRGSGRYGAAVGLPNIVGLPAGVWLTEHVGHREVFLIAGLAGLLGTLVAMLVRVPGERSGADRRPSRSRVPAMALFLPATALITTAVASGGVVTFLAVALTSSALTSWALFAFGLFMIIGRWTAGVWADRYRRPVALRVGVVVGALGIVGIAATVAGGPAVAALAGAAMFGAGFGAVQSDTLIILFQRAGSRRIGEASAVWNIAYDAGFGIGAIGVGALAAVADFGLAFAATALVVATSLLVRPRPTPSK